MQIVIDIPERILYGIQNGITRNGSVASQIVLNAVKNSTPLPKGHGDLVDLKEVVDAFWDGNFMEIWEDDLKKINVVVKADKEVADGSCD